MCIVLQISIVLLSLVLQNELIIFHWKRDYRAFDVFWNADDLLSIISCHCFLYWINPIVIWFRRTNPAQLLMLTLLCHFCVTHSSARMQSQIRGKIVGKLVRKTNFGLFSTKTFKLKTTLLQTSNFETSFVWNFNTQPLNSRTLLSEILISLHHSNSFL